MNPGDLNVRFPDGRMETNPYQDSLGYYQSRDDYLHGEDPSELDDTSTDDAYDTHDGTEGDDDW